MLAPAPIWQTWQMPCHFWHRHGSHLIADPWIFFNQFETTEISFVSSQWSWCS